MLICPVRHHSPAAALQVARLIRARRPKVVLVEGPADATPTIDLLLDRATVPPVALYAFRRQDGDVRATFYPLCAYSPEYVALREGRAVGARLAFCDLPAGATLGWEDPRPDADPEPAGDAPTPSDYARFASGLADAAGFDSFEAFWEAGFEQQAAAGTADEYLALMADFGARARALTVSDRLHQDATREWAMAAAARAAVADGVGEDDVLLVCGAAHARAIAEAYAAGAEPETPLAETVPAEIALIPYSYPRLSEQAGYGAGNRAPWYYQQVWELGGDYAAATRRALVVAARHLRARGYAASSGQAIDAYTLAATLAGLREKHAPGVDELVDAAVACFGQGKGDLVAAAVKQVLIGDAIGRLTPRVGRTPLQQEFYATVDRLRLPVQDAPKQVLVHLAADPVEAEQSVFLHRLVVAGVPFARELQSGLAGRGQAAQGGALEQLGRAREKWELQWTPSTDARLIERSAWGSALAEVCARLLGKRLDEARRIDDGTEVLLHLAVCDLAASETFATALRRCDALAADSVSFPPLARATFHLDGLLAYGAARKLPTGPLLDLAGRLFERALLHLPSAAVCGDDGADEVREALTSLHDLQSRGSPVATDPDGYWAALEAVTERPDTHPLLRGVALVLLDLGGRIDRDRLAARLRYWLSMATDAADNARLVSGLFSLHRGTLVRNPALVGAVTDFLLELEVEQLVPLLPVLRRSLGGLAGPERSYLSETLARVLGLEQGRAARALAVSSADLEWLREADRAVAATLDTWKERYGIGA